LASVEEQKLLSLLSSERFERDKRRSRLLFSPSLTSPIVVVAVAVAVVAAVVAVAVHTAGSVAAVVPR